MARGTGRQRGAASSCRRTCQALFVCVCGVPRRGGPSGCGAEGRCGLGGAGPARCCGGVADVGGVQPRRSAASLPSQAAAAGAGGPPPGKSAGIPKRRRDSVRPPGPPPPRPSPGPFGGTSSAASTAAVAAPPSSMATPDERGRRAWALRGLGDSLRVLLSGRPARRRRATRRQLQGTHHRRVRWPPATAGPGPSLGALSTATAATATAASSSGPACTPEAATAASGATGGGPSANICWQAATTARSCSLCASIASRRSSTRDFGAGAFSMPTRAPSQAWLHAWTLQSTQGSGMPSLRSSCNATAFGNGVCGREGVLRCVGSATARRGDPRLPADRPPGPRP